LLIPITRQLGIKVDLIVQNAPDPRIRRPVIRRDGVLIVPLSPESSAVHTYKITFPSQRGRPHQREQRRR